MNITLSFSDETTKLITDLTSELKKYNATVGDFPGPGSGSSEEPAEPAEASTETTKEDKPPKPKRDKPVTATDIKKIQSVIAKVVKTGVSKEQCVELMRDDFVTTKVADLMQSKRDAFIVAIECLKPIEAASDDDDSGL